jgi:CRP-like cAMP-binding protein
LPSNSAPELAVAALRRCRLFAGADDDVLRAVAATLRLRRYRRGETIFHQGDPGDAMFIVQEGSVRIVLPGPDGTGDAILASMGPGAYFGELVLLDGAPRSASAVAVAATETLMLGRVAFVELLRSQPGLAASLIAGLASELRRLTEDVEELRFLDLHGRVAARLVRAARTIGELNADGLLEAPWPHTQGDLAAMVGGTRPSVNRVLVDLTERGLVKFLPGTLIVPDVGRLEGEAQR